MKRTVIKAGLCVVFTSTLMLPAVAYAAPANAPAKPADMSTKLAGTTVFLDPGHQGTNITENLSKQVPDGRGGTKDCQTTGMTSLHGVPEHTINWNVAQLVKSALQSLGARVVMSRNDDTGWGGCINERAAAANASGAAVAISIHADGAPAADHGFHMIIPSLPIPDQKANEVQSTRGLAASKAVRDAYLKAGFSPANYANVQDGLQTRSDIAGPALTEVPDAFIEMGNGANPGDAALLESPDGQLKHAIAITTGLVTYLLGSGQSAAIPVVPSTSTPTADTNGQQSALVSPGATDPTSSGPAKSAPAETSSMVATAVGLLRPLLSALGLPDTLMSDANVNTVSDLASKLLGIVLQSGGLPTP